MNTANRVAVCLLSVALLGACSSRPPAPVLERSSSPRSEIPVDGLYRVNRGDTLYGIAFEYGLDYREIASWNNVGSPYVIYPDQVLRLRPPPAGSKVSSRRPSGGTRTTAAPNPKAVTRAAEPVNKRQTQRSLAAKAEPENATRAPSAGRWRWPIEGRVVRSFQSGDPGRKGIDIAGREGQSVLASAAGEVVYSGNGLIGYGELVIVKHDSHMLSAYAHNRRRLVAEGERVAGGQKIAELGRNDANQPVLHFEIRRDGQPVNPLSYLARP